MFKAIKKFLGIRSDSEKFQAGVDYVLSEVQKFGAGNTKEMERLWDESACVIDPSTFEKGMVQELNRLNIPDPQSHWNN